MVFEAGRSDGLKATFLLTGSGRAEPARDKIAIATENDHSGWSPVLNSNNLRGPEGPLFHGRLTRPQRQLFHSGADACDLSRKPWKLCPAQNSVWI